MNELPVIVGRLPGAAYLVLVFAVLQLVVAILLAVAVKGDAEERKIRSQDAFLLSPFVWSFVVFMSGGYFGALAYWLIHYSTLSGPRKG